MHSSELKKFPKPTYFFEKLKYIYRDVNFKRELMIFKILYNRIKAILTIQKNTRRFLVRQQYLFYKERKKLFYYIPYSAIPLKDYNKKMNSTSTGLTLKVVYPRSKQNKYFLKFCKFRKLYVAYLPKDEYLNINCIYFIFSDNGRDFIDSQYEIISNENQKSFCNKIDLKAYNSVEKNYILHLRKKFISSEISLNKYQNNFKVQILNKKVQTSLMTKYGLNEKCEKFHHVAKHLKRYISLRHESESYLNQHNYDLKILRSQSHKTNKIYLLQSKSNFCKGKLLSF